jgi:hypothetical protein
VGTAYRRWQPCRGADLLRVIAQAARTVHRCSVAYRSDVQRTLKLWFQALQHTKGCTAAKRALACHWLKVATTALDSCQNLDVELPLDARYDVVL